MTYFGMIGSYNHRRGEGTISPEKGGKALSFKKSDVQQANQEPQVGQRFTYETYEIYGGKKRAIYLQHEDEEASEIKN